MYPFDRRDNNLHAFTNSSNRVSPVPGLPPGVEPGIVLVTTCGAGSGRGFEIEFNVTSAVADDSDSTMSATIHRWSAGPAPVISNDSPAYPCHRCFKIENVTADKCLP